VRAFFFGRSRVDQTSPDLQNDAPAASAAAPSVAAPSSARARHRARGPLLTARSIVSSALVIATATFVAVTLSGTSYATWNGQATVSSHTVVSGSASLTVSSSFVASQWSNLLVGETARQTFSVANTGTIPLALVATGTTATSTFEVRVAPGACSGALTGATVTSTPKSLGTIAAGATATQCVEVKLVSGATAGSSSAFTVTVTGTQVP
jgi:hypothetical protein